jgi:hypothetical protein
VASRHNYQNLLDKAYTFLPPLAFHEAPAFESEMIALELLKYAAEHHMKLSVHYCSHAYKAVFQRLARRLRGAAEAVTELDQVTDAGYVRRLSVHGLPKQIQEVATASRERRVPGTLWAQDRTGTELAFDPTFLSYVQSQGHSLIVSYYEAHIVSEGHLDARKLESVREITLESGQKVYVGTKMVAQYQVGEDEAKRFSSLVGGKHAKGSAAPEGNSEPDAELRWGTELDRWEVIEGGFPAIPSSQRV